MSWFRKKTDKKRTEEPVAQIISVRQIRPTPTLRRRMPKIGRNDPCICGSDKKFKKCCLYAPARFLALMALMLITGCATSLPLVFKDKSKRNEAVSTIARMGELDKTKKCNVHGLQARWLNIGGKEYCLPCSEKWWTDNLTVNPAVTNQ